MQFMASRRAPASKPEIPILTVEQRRRRIERLQNCIRQLEAFDPQKVQKRSGVPEVLALEAAIKDVLSAAFGPGTPTYNRYSAAFTLDNGRHFARSDFVAGSVNYEAQDARQARQYLTEGKEKSIVLLKQAICTIEEEIADQEHLATPPSEQQRSKIHARKVFVVHGHDESALQAVARFLEKLKLEAIILREQPDQGRTIIEKFEAYAAEVGFAVVLLTPDDFAGLVEEPLHASRARQNVIFELGYFVGRLGRGRACLLRKGEVEIPSDLYGVIYTDLDAAEGWKLKLVKELKAAKLDFDANQMWA
jgi:predicted nucleotide-binding protein